nr:nucleotide disphospho-sugar-binding domain-containing protein [Paracoccus saliphilus]
MTQASKAVLPFQHPRHPVEWAGSAERTRRLKVLLICPPLHSHLRAFEALALALQARGHGALFLTEPGTQLSAQVRVLHLPGNAATATSGGLWSDIRQGARRTDRLCRFGPAILAEAAPDLILGDQTEPAAGLLAAALGLPMLSVACALPFDPEPGVPLPFLPWPHDPSEQGLRRNQAGVRVARLLMTPHRRVIRRWSARWDLGLREDFADCLSPIFTLSQTVPGFDFPRPQSGNRIAHLGPFRDRTAEVFPSDIRPDPDRPLIYVSLGTLQGHRAGLLARIARACRDLGAQVLVSHGNGLDDRQAARIPADWVRGFVPQSAILGRATLCVTHAGLNTTLECLAQGVPMLAVPLTHDQPGVAARIEGCGAGLRLGRAGRSRRGIEAALTRMLTEPQFRASAQAFARESGGWQGAAGAVDRIEAVMEGPAQRAASR